MPGLVQQYVEEINPERKGNQMEEPYIKAVRKEHRAFLDNALSRVETATGHKWDTMRADLETQISVARSDRLDRGLAPDPMREIEAATESLIRDVRQYDDETYAEKGGYIRSGIDPRIENLMQASPAALAAERWAITLQGDKLGWDNEIVQSRVEAYNAVVQQRQDAPQAKAIDSEELRQHRYETHHHVIIQKEQRIDNSRGMDMS